METIFNLKTDATEPLLKFTKRFLGDSDAVAITDSAEWINMGRILQDKKVQVFPKLRVDMPKFMHWPRQLCPVDERRMLVSDQRGLWIVTPPADPTTRPALVTDSPEPKEKQVLPPVGGELPWSSVHSVYDYYPENSEYRMVFSPIFHDGQVYVTAAKADGVCNLLNVRVSDGSVTKLGEGKLRIKFDRDKRPEARLSSWGFDHHAALLEKAYCLADMSSQVTFFPLDGSPSHSTAVGMGYHQALGGVGDTLLLSVWHPKLGGRVYRFDVSGKNRPTEFISPDRAAKQSPLDGLADLHVSLIEGDPDRKLILFLAYRDVPDPDINGLYSCDQAGQNIQRVLPLFISPHPTDLVFRRERDCEFQFGGVRHRKLVMTFSRAMIAIDLATNQATVISQDPNLPSMLDPAGQKAATLVESNDLMNGRILPTDFRPPFDLSDKWLWTGSSRISLDGKTYESFPATRRVENTSSGINESVYLSPDGRHLLAADQLTMWDYPLDR